MNKRIQIDLLNEKTVSIITIESVIIDDVEYEIRRSRKAYNNSTIDRSRLSAEIGEPYTTAVFAVWGDSATIDDSPMPE